MERGEAVGLLAERGPGRLKTYRRRWFLLAVVCLLNCSNAMLWLTFAPVADQTAAYFHISLEMVNWLSVVYLLISIPFGLVATWVLDSVGLRCAVILSAWLNMMGSIIRMFSVLKFMSLGSQNYWYLFVGQCLCALAQPLVIFSPTKLAALWFPDHQRATANMISSMSNPLGILIANVLSPALVPEGRHIPLMLGVYAIPAVTACVLATVGIHEKVPPTPPSASATNSTSQPFFMGLKMLLRNRPYIILAVCFGGGIGMFTCFSALLEQILCEKGYSNVFAGLNGALFTVCGLLGAFLLGLYVDQTRNFIESTKICFCLSALASIVFAVASRFRDQAIALAVTSSIFGFFGFAMYPVAMELAVECSYPVGEGTSTGLIFVASQIEGVIFMILLQALTVRVSKDPSSTCALDQDGALDWTTPVLLLAGLCSAMACFYVIFFHTDYKRLHAETNSSDMVKAEDTGSEDVPEA
ncbi:major facilitator superfamily domain-containing protein 7 isoform X1 [Numida meleagris]|uniref:major facilitator superfamily domain-containing protein 7 isoform X1 n=2 Tax=Numida meleagris TaxID=8996 RepID=UPI000B3E1A77|nr:major facilitator superfamily domain-containing protein 7 isoform X1 [Numida meleagris]